MKKLAVTTLTLLTCGTAFALPVGNPYEASIFQEGAWWDAYNCVPCDPCFCWFDAWSLRIGFYGDYVFNRHLRAHNHEAISGNNIQRTEIFTNAGYLALNLCDRVDFFGTLGATNIFIQTDSIAFTPTSFISDLVFSPAFSWSLGARGTLWQCDCFCVGVEGQYFQTRPDFDRFVRGDIGDFTFFDADNKVRYREWQVGLGASYIFTTHYPTLSMIPYAAVKWSHANFKFNDFTFTDPTAPAITATIPDLKSKKVWGYAIGMTLALYEMIGVTVEGRWADEKAVYVNGQFRF